MSHFQPGQAGHEEPGAVAARSMFDQWLCSVARGGAAELPSPGQCLLLGADTSLMPAAARLCLPGADAPTYAHAVGLLQMLCDRGIATDWTTACRVVGELPVALLHEYTEAIDANLVTSTESSRRGLAGAGA